MLHPVRWLCEGWELAAVRVRVEEIASQVFASLGVAGLAGEGPVVSEGPVARRLAQVDAAYGRVSRGGPTAVTAGRDVLDHPIPHRT